MCNEVCNEKFGINRGRPNLGPRGVLLGKFVKLLPIKEEQEEKLIMIFKFQS